MHKFVILAVRDISKSEFSESENLNTAAQRNITTDTATNENEAYSNNIFWNRPNFMNSKCLKFILKPLEPPSENLITAFEFDGSISGHSGASTSSLCGSILEVAEGPLDYCRGILLLHRKKCKYITNQQGPIDIVDDQLDDDAIESFFNDMDDI